MVGPIEAGARGPRLQLGRALPFRQATGDAGQRGGIVGRFRHPLCTLPGFPRRGLRLGIGDRRTGEHMRMPPGHLVADRRADIAEIEGALLSRHLRVEHHLQQQVAQLVL